MAKNTRVPHVSNEIVNFLKEEFPDRIPDTIKSEAEYGVLIGEQKVIRRLQKILDSQIAKEFQ